MSRVPRIRFKGFEEDWEQRKLSEIALRESNFRLSSPDLPCVEYEDVVSEAGILNNDIRSKKIVKTGIVFDDNHVLYGKLRPYLHNWLCPYFSGVAVGDWWVLKPCYVVREFIYRIIQTKRFDNATNQSYGSKMPRADWNLVSNTEFMIPPDSSEQEKIGLYFKEIDNLITLHQRKLEKLKIIKKSMLENLFPQNGEKTPKNRFSGFTKDWEQRKLGDMAERIIRKNEKLESTLPLTISAQYGLIDQNEFFDKRIASKDVRGYYLIKKGEFAYNKSTSVDAPLGAIKRLDKYKNGVLSTLYILFKIIDDTSTSSDYLVTYYVTDLWHRGIQSIAAEGARNHGLLNIAPNDFFETMLSIPLNISEQKKVGDFFISLDHLITLHQSKLEKLQKIKKSMLESMFV